MNYFEISVQIRQWVRFFLEKTSPSPTLPFCMKISWRAGGVYYSSILIEHASWRNLHKFFKNFNRCYSSRQNLFSNFVDLIYLAYLPGWYCNPQLLHRCFSTNFCASPLPFYHNKFIVELSVVFIKEKFLNNTTRIYFWSQSSWKLRLQPTVASNFGGNPFMDGILGHNLLLSRAFSVGIPSWMGF
jgi:hypothetical protein